MTARHCHECGAPLEVRTLEGEGRVPWCPACREWRFPLYSVAVSMVVVSEATGRVLLIRQYGRPGLILVAGYVARGESLEHAVRREVAEETSLAVGRVRFNGTRFFEPSDTLMCNFTAWVPDEDATHPNAEVDSYEWLTPDEARRRVKPASLAADFLCAALDTL